MNKPLFFAHTNREVKIREERKMVCCKCNKVIPDGSERVCSSCGNTYCQECAQRNYDLCDCFSELGYRQ